MMTNGFNGKKVMHSKPASPFGGGSVRMPAQAKPKMNPPTGHTCKVCPGASRSR